MRSCSMAQGDTILANDAGPLVRLGWTLVSIAALAAIWHLAAIALQSRVLPGPIEVTSTFLNELKAGALAWHLGATLARVAASFFLAVVIGTAIGLALGRLRWIDRFFDSWLILFLNLPVLVVIILCYVWFGLTEVAAITAVAINKIPNFAVTMREGTLRHVILPQLAPFFMAAVRSGLALVWKIVLVVELLGRSNGVGYQLNVAFQLFDVSLILAYAIAFILVVQMNEVGILQPLKVRAGRWRR